MKFVCDREKLREGLAVVNNVVPAKSPKPVLENVCLVATKDAIEILATDLECSVRYRIPAGRSEPDTADAVEQKSAKQKNERILRGGVVDIIEPGVCVIPARVALDFVRDLAVDEVVLTTHENLCTIAGGEDSCELVTIDADEFPVISAFSEGASFSISGGAFTRLVGRTAFAAAREAGRYAMHGVLAEIEDGSLRLVATDGRRLALASAPADIRPIDQVKPAIVPTKAMQLFCRVIADPLEAVQVHFGANQVGVKTRSAEIFARLIDGEFPRYSAVIPRDATKFVEADAATLAQKLRLVANVTGVEARAVKFKVEDGELELFGHSVGRGEASARMQVDYKGPAAEIAFNPDYVLDGLKNCEGGMVKLAFNDKTSPGKFTLGENYVYIVMPITVDA